MSPEERLKWLEANQPRNLAAINAVRAQLGLELVKAAEKKAYIEPVWRLRTEPYHHWQNRDKSSN